MVAYKQRKVGGVIYCPLRCLSPIRPCMAAYLGHRAADKGRQDPQHSSQPDSHHPLRHHHRTVRFDGGLIPFEVLIMNFL